MSDTFRYTLSEFKQLSDEQQRSDTWEFGGCNWRLTVYPKGGGTAKGKSVSVFLHCMRPATCKGFDVSTTFAVSAVCPQDGAKTHTQTRSRSWSDSTGWGWLEFIPLESVDGLLVDGAMVFECKYNSAVRIVATHPPYQIHRDLSEVLHAAHRLRTSVERWRSHCGRADSMIDRANWLRGAPWDDLCYHAPSDDAHDRAREARAAFDSAQDTVRKAASSEVVPEVPRDHAAARAAARAAAQTLEAAPGASRRQAWLEAEAVWAKAFKLERGGQKRGQVSPASEDGMRLLCARRDRARERCASALGAYISSTDGEGLANRLSVAQQFVAAHKGWIVDDASLTEPIANSKALLRSTSAAAPSLELVRDRVGTTLGSLADSDSALRQRLTPATTASEKAVKEAVKAMKLVFSGGGGEHQVDLAGVAALNSLLALQKEESDWKGAPPETELVSMIVAVSDDLLQCAKDAVGHLTQELENYREACRYLFLQPALAISAGTGDVPAVDELARLRGQRRSLQQKVHLLKAHQLNLQDDAEPNEERGEFLAELMDLCARHRSVSSSVFPAEILASLGSAAPRKQQAASAASDLRRMQRERQVVDTQVLEAFARAWQVKQDHFPELPVDVGGCLHPGLAGVFSEDRGLHMYEDREKLAESNHAVFRATFAGKRCVLKAFPLESDDRRRQFLKEARLARSLKHHTVVPVECVFIADGTGYVQMPLYDADLAAWAKEKKRPTAKLLLVARGILHALDHLHSCGVVHGDLKPANILMDADLRPRGAGGLRLEPRHLGGLRGGRCRRSRRKRRDGRHRCQREHVGGCPRDPWLLRPRAGDRRLRDQGIGFVFARRDTRGVVRAGNERQRRPACSGSRGIPQASISGA
ncbi:unnamed protein product [Prorocentrum cordatum]|uniref:Protein kinase domain-containing protein n=1 Tax=Prorocentrum cordatum TaxID=2364126 RepID=A0ABN9S1C7_9DINO|nr:unnamed protein product [Polarella glacialis]